jgi:hypothetical protein
MAQAQVGCEPLKSLEMLLKKILFTIATCNICFFSPERLHAKRTPCPHL